jgi:UDP-2,3-diacylglucosamine pyrophosphatase LpxH
MKTDIVAGDFHIPYYDKKSLTLFLFFLKHIEPDRIFLNGDIIDCYNISNYEKDPKRIKRFKDEIDKTKKLLTIIRRMSPNSEIIYIYGNHEDRLRRYKWKFIPELADLKQFNLEELLELKKFGIKPVYSEQKETYYDTGNGLLIGHFNMVRKFSGYTAKGLMDKYGISLIQGHTHRLGSSIKRSHNNLIESYEGGCLCSFDVSYALHTDWQHGFCLINWDENDFYIQQILIKNGSFVYDGLKFDKP